MKAAVVCFSGGLDSTTLATLYRQKGYRLLLLSFDYGQKHGVRELSAARAVADYLGARHHVIDLTSLTGLLIGSALTDSRVTVPDGHYAEDSMRATVVPNRNAIMANLAIGAASSTGADMVALGVHAGDHAVYPDCRPEFFGALVECMRQSLRGFSTPALEAPFLYRSKTDIVTIADDLRAPVHLSWSCYKGGGVHCGTCGTCTERKEAFEDAGVTDPTVYAA